MEDYNGSLNGHDSILRVFPAEQKNDNTKVAGFAVDAIDENGYMPD